VFLALIVQHGKSMRNIILPFLARSSPPCPSTVFHRRQNCRV